MPPFIVPVLIRQVMLQLPVASLSFLSLSLFPLSVPSLSSLLLLFHRNRGRHDKTSCSTSCPSLTASGHLCAGSAPIPIFLLVVPFFSPAAALPCLSRRSSSSLGTASPPLGLPGSAEPAGLLPLHHASTHLLHRLNPPMLLFFVRQ